MTINTNRKSGVLLHPTALPGLGVIGEIGPDAYRFVDHLSDMGQSLWQILPIGPTDNYNSPYSSISTFAGNPLLISLHLLVEDNLLDSKVLDNCEQTILNHVPFNEVVSFKIPILKEVSKNFNLNASPGMKHSFEQFCIDHSYWLDDYAQYCTLKEENGQKSWIDWNSQTPKNKECAYDEKVIQFIFHDQWSRLREYCFKKEIQIIGDMPIYVGYDSADVYANRELFQLDESGRMTYQAGCPPCEYQKEGQLWGTPLYNWDNHEKTNFRWWQKRFKKLLGMVDTIRLDHFIGYSKYYRISMNEKTAHYGEWMRAPGEKLFNVLSSTIKDLNVIAEDLGDVTEEVISLRDKFNFPGMRVLQFEFDQLASPENFPKNSVVYTGTHDNDTILGWIGSLPISDSSTDILTKNKLLKLFNCTLDDIHWEMINYAMSAGSNTTIIPIQDILGKGPSCRFNTPGTLSPNNWSWRMKEELSKPIKTKLMELTKIHKKN